VPEPLERLYAQHTGHISQKWSSYLPVYDRVLAPYRALPVRLLEIGVQNGGSLDIWARYFPAATLLIGCDIDERCAQLRFDDGRIHVIVGDATESDTQEQILARSPTFDVILDDGSHRSDDIIDTFVSLFPRLDPGGVYVIEDLHCSYWEGFGGGLHAQRSAMSFLKRLVDVINADHWGLDRDGAALLEPVLGRPLPPDLLAALPSIASVEFHDSMCIVRRDGAPSPRLGVRVVVGTSASVEAEPEAHAGLPLARPRETEGPGNVDPIAAEDRVRSLTAELATASARERDLIEALDTVSSQLRRVVTSRSWRMTEWLRRLFRALFRRG
jgi:SAM-dependent methyltransferase